LIIRSNKIRQNKPKRALYEVYLTDVFGPIIPLEHVHDLEDYLQRSIKAQEIVSEELGYEDLTSMLAIFKKGIEAGEKHDKESEAFKRYVELEDHVAKVAYESGEMPFPLEDDVKKTLQRLREAMGRIMIFSSSAVETTQAGMKSVGLDDLIEAYYSSSDPDLGSKFKSHAYETIARKSNITPDKMCYITDSPQEAEAAVEASVGRVYLIDRDSSAKGKRGEYYLINDYGLVVKQTIE
jgi:methionine salvage enolase-phosphatase E1